MRVKIWQNCPIHDITQGNTHNWDDSPSNIFFNHLQTSQCVTTHQKFVVGSVSFMSTSNFQKLPNEIWYTKNAEVLGCKGLKSKTVDSAALSNPPANPCWTRNGGCDKLRTCMPTLGGNRICGDCPRGYTNVGATGCQGQCWQFIGVSIACWISVAYGTTYIHLLICFAGNHLRSDVNECSTNNGGCHPQRKCTNIPGGNVCENCGTGFHNDGHFNCIG